MFQLNMGCGMDLLPNAPGMCIVPSPFTVLTLG